MTLTQDELKNKIGKYTDEKESFIADVSLKDTLIVEARGLSFPIIPLSKSKFISKDAPVDIVIEFFPAEGKAMGARLTFGGNREIPLEKIPDIAPLTLEQLEAYAGSYYNDELPATYVLAIEKGKLLFKHRNAPEEPLKLIAEDKFMSGYGKVDFIRDKRKRISGFYLDAGRVRIRFEKK